MLPEQATGELSNITGGSMRRIGWLCGILLLAAAGGPARADQAADIKQSLEVTLTDWSDNGQMLTHGPVDVASDGGAFVVTIPDLRLFPDAEGYLDVGTVGFRLTPDGDDLYKIDDVKLPAEIPHKLAAGGDDGRISLPSQQVTGVWSKSLENFVQADIAFHDAKLASTSQPPVNVSIGEVTLKLDGTDKGQGHWDEAETYRLANLSAAGPDGTLVIGAIDGKTAITNYNAKAMADFRNQMEARVAKAAAADPNAPPPAPDPQFVDSLRALGALFASTLSTMQLNGISFKDPTGKEVFALPEGSLSFGAEGFDQASGRLALSIAHKGLVVADLEPSMEDVLPQELTLNISLENLPVQELWKGAVDTYASSAMTSDQGASMAFAMFPALLQQALIAGKSKINLTDWRIVGPLAQAQLAGTIEASAASALSATGKLKLDITGLDKLVDAIKTQSGPEAPELAQLEVLRGFSNRQTGSDGTVVDHYDIELTQQGQFLVNGKEFPLLGGGGGEMPPSQDGAPAPDQGTTPDNSGTTSN